MIEETLALFTETEQNHIATWADDCTQTQPPKGLKKMWKRFNQAHPASPLPDIEIFWRRFHLSKQLDNMAYPLSSKAILFIRQQSMIEEGESFHNSHT